MSRSYFTPAYIRFYPRYTGLMNSIILGYNKLRAHIIPYFLDIGIFQLCMPILFAKSIATLIGGITIIIQFCAKKQMVRINAFPVITFMAGDHSFRNRPFIEFPGDSMGTKQNVFPVHRPRPYSIPSIIKISIPVPASLQLFKMGFKFGEWGFCRKIVNCAVLALLVITPLTQASSSNWFVRFAQSAHGGYCPEILDIICHDIGGCIYHA